MDKCKRKLRPNYDIYLQQSEDGINFTKTGKKIYVQIWN